MNDVIDRTILEYGTWGFPISSTVKVVFITIFSFGFVYLTYITCYQNISCSSMSDLFSGSQPLLNGTCFISVITLCHYLFQ